MKRDAALRAKLFSVNGFPKSALRRALEYFDAPNLNALESRVDSGELDAFSFSRLRGSGHKGAPGALMQYLFGLPSLAQNKAKQIETLWTHGADI